MHHLLLSLLFIATLLHGAPSALSAEAGPSARHLQISLLPEHGAIAAGGSLRIAIRQDIAPGWHTYWVNAGDSGEPMKIQWTLPAGFQMGALQWPIPTRVKTGPLLSYGYHGQAVMVQTLKAPAKLPDGPVTLTADIDTLVCHDICIPERDRLTLTLNDGKVLDNSALVERAVARTPVPLDANLTYYETDGVLEIAMSKDLFPDRTLSPEDIAIFPYDWGLIENAADVDVRDDGSRIVVAAPRGTQPIEENQDIRLMLTVGQGDAARAFDVIASTDEPVISDAPEPVGGFAGLAKAMLFALLGGLILNLMPCVFPVLSMKALSLVKMSEREPGHARKYGLTYAAGVISCFVLIAVVLMTLKSGGEQIGWGFQLQSPLVVLGLAWLLFLIGLNLSGLFEISGSFTNVGANLASREGLKGSFFTGVLAAVVATPCTAPLMGVAIGYAMTHPMAYALPVFMALGLGLSLPLLLVSFLPPLQRLFPRPGHWMQTFREFLAFPMYASSVLLVWVYLVQVGPDGTIPALGGMVLLAAAAWAVRIAPETGIGRSIALLFALLLLIAAGGLAATHRSIPDAPTDAAPIAGEAEPYSPDRLEALLKGDNPVFVNMTADWCITCKVNEKTTLASESVKGLMRDRHIHYLQGDWTRRNADITEFLESHGRNGVPLYVFYGRRGADGTRPDPEILPQILTPAIMRESFETEY